MAHYLPSNILALFEPRELAVHLPLPLEERRPSTAAHYSSNSDCLHHLQNYNHPIVPPKPTHQQARENRKRKREKNHKKLLEHLISRFDSRKNSDKKTKESYRTLFISRLSYRLTEEDLKKEFSYYGPIVSVHLIRDIKTNKSRGYAFIEFESSKDLSEAYKDADGRKLDGRKIKVDVERGRTVKNWLPRRLGGGLGDSRIAKEKKPERIARTADELALMLANEPQLFQPQPKAPRSLPVRRPGPPTSYSSSFASTSSSSSATSSYGYHVSSGRDRRSAHSRSRSRSRSNDRRRSRDRDRERDGGRSRSPPRRSPEKDRFKERERERDNKDERRDRSYTISSSSLSSSNSATGKGGGSGLNPMAALYEKMKSQQKDKDDERGRSPSPKRYRR